MIYIVQTPIIKNREAFTLIEVLISVIIISTVILGMMKAYEQNTGMALYVLNRAGDELVNSLFLSRNLDKYKSSKKNSYFILKENFVIKDDEVREILKGIEKKIDFTEKKKLKGKRDKDTDGDNHNELNFYSNKILLQDSYLSRYYQINL